MPQIAVEDTPVDLASSLSLDSGTQYVVQAELFGKDAILHLDDSDSAPTAENIGTQGFKLKHLDAVLAQPGDGGSLWAWVPTGRRWGRLNVFEWV